MDWIGSWHCRVRKSDLEAVAAGGARKFHCNTYNEDDGLLADETNGRQNHPSACKTSDGRIWFPTPRGVVVFDPRYLPDVANPPSLAIEQVRANGQPVYENASAPDGPVLFNDPTFPASPNAPVTPASEMRDRGLVLSIPPGGAHVLEIQYTASTFKSAEDVHFKYRLKGFDKEWVDAGSRRTAFYGNLRPGHYQFQVVGVNKYGAWNESGAGLTIQLQPHFHETWWFYTLCALVIGTTVLAFHRWRLGYVQRIHRLERDTALTQDRTRIVRDLHDGLGAQLTQLTILAELSDQPESGQPGFEERLRQLSRLARGTASQLKEIVWSNHPCDETLDGLAARICQYAEQFLRPAGIRCRFNLPENLPLDRISADARHHLFLVAKEALNNAAKHSAATEVSVEVSLSEDTLYLLIADNGRGFDPRPSHHNSLFPITGHGLRNMRQPTESLGGKFAITHPPKGGTEVRFEVSLHLLAVS